MRALAVALLLGAIAACGVTLQETEASIYTAADQACVAQGPDYDAVVACVRNNRQIFCGPSGVFADAGICPEGGK